MVTAGTVLILGYVKGKWVFTVTPTEWTTDKVKKAEAVCATNKGRASFTQIPRAWALANTPYTTVCNVPILQPGNKGVEGKVEGKQSAARK